MRYHNSSFSCPFRGSLLQVALTRFARRCRGFTMVELLVVIAIIVVMVSMGAPTISGYRQTRHLRDSARLVQGVFVQARSLAIAQHKEVRVIFFASQDNQNIQVGATNFPVKGDIGTVYTYVADETVSPPKLFQYGQPTTLPKHVRFLKLGDPTLNNKEYTFNTDGTLFFNNDQDTEPDAEGVPDIEDKMDIVVHQPGSAVRCYMDIIKNTGHVRFHIPLN